MLDDKISKKKATLRSLFSNIHQIIDESLREKISHEELSNYIIDNHTYILTKKYKNQEYDRNTIVYHLLKFGYQFDDCINKLIDTSEIDAPDIHSKIFCFVHKLSTSRCVISDNHRFVSKCGTYLKFCSKSCECSRSYRRILQKNKTNAEREQENNKRRNTNLERIGYENPLFSPVIIDKLKKTYWNKTESERRLIYDERNEQEILKKRKQTMLSKFGVETNLLLDETPRADPWRHLSSNTKSILNDENKLRELSIGKTIQQVATELDTSYSLIQRISAKFNIEFNTVVSVAETEIADFISNLDIKVIRRTRNVIPPQEIDIFIPSFGIAIEYNGLYYHCDGPRGKTSNTYHRDKMRLINKKGFRLIQINEDEWLFRKNQVKNRLINIFNKSEQGVGARKLIIKQIEIKEAQAFTEKNHIQGKVYDCIQAVGAFHNSILIAVMTFGKQRNTNDIEMSRFCTDGKNYPGCFSRMFKWSVSEFKFYKVISMADLRYSEGAVYEKNGFKHVSTTRVDYRYVKGNKTYHKKFLSKANIRKRFKISTDNKTESQLAKELKFQRIWDCGKLKFVWQRSQ